MNVIQELKRKHSAVYLREMIGVTGATWRLWAMNPATITFKNMTKLYDAGLITKDQKDELFATRDKYLLTIKGERGAHLKTK